MQRDEQYSHSRQVLNASEKKILYPIERDAIFIAMHFNRLLYANVKILASCLEQDTNPV